MLQPKALPEVLGEMLAPGMRAVTLMNRSGLQLGSAGDESTATVIRCAARAHMYLHTQRTSPHISPHLPITRNFPNA